MKTIQLTWIGVVEPGVPSSSPARHRCCYSVRFGDDNRDAFDETARENDDDVDATTNNTELPTESPTIRPLTDTQRLFLFVPRCRSVQRRQKNLERTRENQINKTTTVGTKIVIRFRRR